MWGYLLTLLSLLIAIFSWFAVKRYDRMKQIREKLPGLSAHWLFGNFHHFYNKTTPELFHILMDMHTIYGKNLTTWGIFNSMHYNFIDVKTIEKILLAKTIAKSSLYDFLHIWLGEGLLVSKGDKWFKRRKILTPTFHFKILEKFIEIFNKHSDYFVDKIAMNADTGKEFDIYNLVSLCTLDIICETSMGILINAQKEPDNEYVQSVKRLSEIIFRQVFSIFSEYRMLFDIFHPLAYEKRRVVKILHEFTDSVIIARRKVLESEIEEEMQYQSDDTKLDGVKQKLTFLDMLLHVTVEGKPLSNADIREEVDTFMFEGHDTTTSGIGFTIYHLSRHPDVQERLYQEIKSHFGENMKNSQLDYSSLQDLKYLDMVIKESLRISPPVAVIGRTILDDTTVNGSKLIKNIDVSVSIYSLHHEADNFPDPEKFDPERFSDEANTKRGPYNYIPFSIGPRNCIGQKFALLEMKVLLIKLLAHYKILPGNTDMEYKLDLVLRPVKGIFVKIEKRL